MTKKNSREALDRLKSHAMSRANANADMTRVVLQLDHSSSAVGGGEVAAALAEGLSDSAYIVVAGSDGASFQAPKVVVTTPDGVVRSFMNVTSQDVAEIVRQIGEGLEEPDDDEPFMGHQRRIALDSAGAMSATDINEYVLQGGYSGLARALETSPEAVIDEVKESGLRGRGGAYFPAALKWEGARRVDRSPKYLVVNSEEGEPGIFKDRLLMEAVPYRILEGMTIAAYATGVEQAYLYINAEAELSAQRMQNALDQARGAGLLGENILGTDFSLNVEIRRGAGGYVCGEETTLLNTMEGYRREPRPRPPFPTESGLWAMPTVINNPETLCSVSFILANGADEFKKIGSEAAPARR